MHLKCLKTNVDQKGETFTNVQQSIWRIPKASNSQSVESFQAIHRAEI